DRQLRLQVAPAPPRGQDDLPAPDGGDRTPRDFPGSQLFGDEPFDALHHLSPEIAPAGFWCHNRPPARRARSGGTAPAPLGGSGLGRWGPWHPRAMDKVLVPVRDLTDSDQTQAVLDVASALADGRAAGSAAASHGPAVAAEAMAAARSRRRLGALTGPVHLT